MIIIGCPVYRREWILPAWFKAIEDQDFPLDQLGFVFIMSPDDEGTLSLLLEFSHKHPEIKCFDLEQVDDYHEENPDNKRLWTPKRYATMVNLRTRLLERVRCHNPDKFFSLDSDILLENPRTISILNTLTDNYDAVSPLAFMTPVTAGFPSVMSWRLEDSKKAYRRDDYPLGRFFQAEIIMAAVMQSKSVYENVNYHWHKQGEDLGWSRDATDKGYKLYSASYLYCPHIMNEEQFLFYKQYGDSLKMRREAIVNT